MRFLAIAFGLILLLPGLCSLGFMVVFLPGGTGAYDAPLILVWLVCFAISFGGFTMIRRALNPRRKDAGGLDGAPPPAK